MTTNWRRQSAHTCRAALRVALVLWSHNVRPTNEVPASREMDLKLPQNLSRPSSEQQFDLGEDEHRGRGASRELTPRSARTPSFNSKFPAVCEVAHTSRWDWQPIRGAAPGRCGLERSARGCRAENKSVEPQRAESRTRPALVLGEPPARADQATT